MFGLSPQDALIDTEVELYLEGENLYGLEPLAGVNIAGTDVPVLHYATEADESMVVQVYLPPDLATGETEIAFFFENYQYGDCFFVGGGEPGPGEPGAPQLWGVDPQEGDVDTEVELYLEGENLFELGDLAAVSINGIEIPVLGYKFESNEEVLMRITCLRICHTAMGPSPSFLKTPDWRSPSSSAHGTGSPYLR